MKLVIFAGGSGTRLWPLSRKNSPKQFGKVIGDKSTLQQTVERLLPDFSPSDIYIATGKQYEAIVTEQLPFIPKENFIFEPAMRDVGPALGMVACMLQKHFANEPVAILWSDHLVKKEEVFRKILRLAEEKVKNHEADFVFITQKPRFANQNMGWIEVGEKIEERSEGIVFAFKRLLYRPGPQQAEKFFQDEHYVWNLGYFVTTPQYLASLFQEQIPAMYEQLISIADAWGTDDFDSVAERIYPQLEKISFDDAILVKLHHARMIVITSDLEWSDIGAWESLKEALTKSKEENLTKGNVIVEDTEDSLIFNYTNQLVVGIDLQEMLVINTEDVLLVCPKNSVPKIKKLVEKLSGTVHEKLT